MLDKVVISFYFDDGINLCGKILLKSEKNIVDVAWFLHVYNVHMDLSQDAQAMPH